MHRQLGAQPDGRGLFAAHGRRPFRGLQRGAGAEGRQPAHGRGDGRDRLRPDRRAGQERQRVSRQGPVPLPDHRVRPRRAELPHRLAGRQPAPALVVRGSGGVRGQLRGAAGEIPPGARPDRAEGVRLGGGVTVDRGVSRPPEHFLWPSPLPPLRSGDS